MRKVMVAFGGLAEVFKIAATQKNHLRKHRGWAAGGIHARLCGAYLPYLSPRASVVTQATGDPNSETKLWGGRFEKAVSDVVTKFGESVSYDQKLYQKDIMGSKAHSKMLASCGLMTEADMIAIHSGLDEILSEIEGGTFIWRSDREDVHLNIEASLTDKIGDPGRKLHTARSRNDQVCTDVRLFVIQEIDSVLSKIYALQISLVQLARENEDIIVPGYTHLQRAQPLLLAHVLLAYVEQLNRDAGRLLDCRERTNFSPLGACALAGTTLPIDRHMTAKDLGFTAPLANSVDAVADRDFLLELLSCLSIISMHMSRIGEDWVLWSSEEFKFMIPDDSVSTGSSIMPQKKNPDPMELVRGKTGRVYGSLLNLLTTCKGLPLAYNRDLQEDKEPLFDALKTVSDCLEVTKEFANNVVFDRDRIKAVLEFGHLDATTLADYLVNKGIPFRTGHDIVGKLVGIAVKRKVSLSDLALSEFQEVGGASIMGDDVYEWLGAENCIAKFSSYGSTGRTRVEEQLQGWERRLELVE